MATVFALPPNAPTIMVGDTPKRLTVLPLIWNHTKWLRVFITENLNEGTYGGKRLVVGTPLVYHPMQKNFLRGFLPPTPVEMIEAIDAGSHRTRPALIWIPDLGMYDWPDSADHHGAWVPCHTLYEHFNPSEWNEAVDWRDFWASLPDAEVAESHTAQV